MKKFVTSTMNGCFRSVCNHPFLVGMLCFLILIYRSYPFVFTLLVSASPILICTAVLLGTLLSFGQRNIPQSEEKTTPLKTADDAIVVEQHNEYYVERYNDKKRDETEESSKTNLGESCVKSSNLNDTSSLIEESKSEKGEISRVLDDGTITDENFESDDEKSVADSFDSERVNVDCLDSPPHSPWKNVEDDHEEEQEEQEQEDDQEEEEEEEEEDALLDSNSERAESSSPDASMADIMPMLDELHPLLDEEAAQNVQTSRDNSDAASDHSSTTTATSTSTNDSIDEIETHDELDDIADDDEDDEDEDAKEDEKEEQAKSAITWTEEDQKNLMDLGSSEIERNQRLENLIMRRRTRKFTSMVPEINLIDLESSDVPFSIAPISTSRQNPFDLPNDSCDNSGLPPIPGSAPSILLPRHNNPFDIPFDFTTEEKQPPNQTGDGFLREEITALHPREPFFRRHESFHVGPSIFAPTNRGEVKMRPYFIPERMALEESNYFHRQSSEMSDSKVSSVPETESVGSVEDLEYQNLPEEDNTPREDHTKMEEVIEECPSEEDREVVSTRELSEEEKEEDVHCEPELISVLEHVSEHIGHGSPSSSSSSSEEEEDSLEVGPVQSVESSEPGGDNLLVEEVPHKEPVYDSSPTKNISSSSSSSDMHVPQVVVKRTVSSTEKESENRDVDENDTNVREHVNVKGDSTVDVSVQSKSSVGASLEENVKDKNIQCEAQSSSSGVDVHAIGDDDDDKKKGELEKEKCLLIKKQDPIDKGETVVSPNSDDDFQEANEKLISTPSAGGSTPLFYDIRMHDPDYEHHDEVQVPNTPVESFENVRGIQNLNISNVHDLDHGISRKINSPFSPNFIAVPPSSSTTSEESTSHNDMETILEEDDEIKEMDGILSELDSVGDFSTTQWGSSSNESDEKHVIDSSVEENSSSANRVEEETSTVVLEPPHAEVATHAEVALHAEVVPNAKVAAGESTAESGTMGLNTNVVGPARETVILEVTSVDNSGENVAEAIGSKKLLGDDSEKEIVSSVGPDKSSVKEHSSVAATEKLEHEEVKAKAVEAKGKSSKKSKSKSGSSSSSSSSSSDSD